MFFEESTLRFALFYEGDNGELFFMGDPSDIEINLLKLQYNSEDSYYYSTDEELNRVGAKQFESFTGKDGSQYFVYKYRFDINMK